MEIKIIKDDKNELQVEIGNLTLVEILRVYLNKDDKVSFAAWKREHPIKSPMLTIKTDGKSPKKAFQDAIAALEKDTEKILDEFKKSK